MLWIDMVNNYPDCSGPRCVTQIDVIKGELVSRFVSNAKIRSLAQGLRRLRHQQSYHWNRSIGSEPKDDIHVLTTLEDSLICSILIKATSKRNFFPRYVLVPSKLVRTKLYHPPD